MQKWRINWQISEAIPFTHPSLVFGFRSTFLGSETYTQAAQTLPHFHIRGQATGRRRIKLKKSNEIQIHLITIQSRAIKREFILETWKNKKLKWREKDVNLYYRKPADSR